MYDSFPHPQQVARPYPIRGPLERLDLVSFPGHIVCVEGPDGGGKSTAVGCLGKELADRGLSVETFAFLKSPLIDYGKLWGKVHSWSARSMFHLYTAGWVDLLERSVLPQLRGGLDVAILDRSAYTIFGRAVARGLPREEATAVLNFLPMPHLLLSMTTPLNLAFERQNPLDSTTFSYWESGGDLSEHEASLRQYGRREDYESAFLAFQGDVRTEIAEASISRAAERFELSSESPTSDYPALLSGLLERVS